MAWWQQMELTVSVITGPSLYKYIRQSGEGPSRVGGPHPGPHPTASLCLMVCRNWQEECIWGSLNLHLRHVGNLHTAGLRLPESLVLRCFPCLPGQHENP